MPEAVTPSSHPLDTMLAVSDVITNRRYPTLYARVLDLGTPTVEEIATGLESSTTTVYEDVDQLSEYGLLERVTETQPHRYSVRPVEVTVRADGDECQISPTLIVALARARSNENLRLFLDRHGIASLATAVDYTRTYVRGQTNARHMARKLEIPVLEAETTLQELREIVLDVEPELETEPDLESVDAAVDERSAE